MKKYIAIAAAILVFVAVAAFGAGDFNKPSGSSLRTGFMAEIRDMFADQAKWFAGTSTTNYPTGAIRLNATTHTLERYNGSTWATLDLTGLNVGSVVSKVPAAASGLATLDSSSKVVQDPASKAAASGIASLDASSVLVQSAGKLTDGTNVLHFKTINIGDWNMDTTDSVSIAHGLTYSKIKTVTASVRRDNDSAAYDLNFYKAGETGYQGVSWTTTNIYLVRAAGSDFDSSTYQATSFNRGWITIWYVD